MSCNYADGLSPYHDKGQLGLEEKFDSKSAVSAKVSLLTKWINEAKHVVIHTGAGISTSAGIPDFRGPRGVWTLQAKGERPDLSKDFNEANPTVTHMAIMKLVDKQKVKYVVSQNIDGLHLRSNLPRKYLSELHGNMFTEQCNSCNRQFIRSSPVPTVGQKSLNKNCPATKTNGRPCRGRLHDTILDWEHNLPENDLGMADYHSCLADLSISLGTTMQIVPSGNLPLYTKRHGGKLVIVNLQPTKHDRKANLVIHAYVDDVMTMLMKNLNLKIPKYTAKNDPTRIVSISGEKFFEWTISDSDLKKMKKIYEEKCGSKEARKRLEMISDDLPLSVSKSTKRKIKEDEDSDLEVLDVIVKPKKSRESSRKSSKKNSAPLYNTTITIKKVTAPPKKAKYEGEKITIKKNVTPTKTKYEIVTKPKKIPKCEIVYSTDDLCYDLDMTCESDDDEMTNNFTYNFKIYLPTNTKSDLKIEPKKEVLETKDSLPEIKSEEICHEKEKPNSSNKNLAKAKEVLFDEKKESFVMEPEPEYILPKVSDENLNLIFEKQSEEEQLINDQCKNQNLVENLSKNKENKFSDDSLNDNSQVTVGNESRNFPDGNIRQSENSSFKIIENEYKNAAEVEVDAPNINFQESVTSGEKVIDEEVTPCKNVTAEEIKEENQNVKSPKTLFGDNSEKNKEKNTENQNENSLLLADQNKSEKVEIGLCQSSKASIDHLQKSVSCSDDNEMSKQNSHDEKINDIEDTSQEMSIDENAIDKEKAIRKNKNEENFFENVVFSVNETETEKVEEAMQVDESTEKNSLESLIPSVKDTEDKEKKENEKIKNYDDSETCENNKKEEETEGENNIINDEIESKDNTSLKVDTDASLDSEPMKEKQSEEKIHEHELEKLINVASENSLNDLEANSKTEDSEGADNKSQNVFSNIDPELSNLSNTNLQSQIQNMVNDSNSSQFTNSIQMHNCNENSSIDFYNNEYSSPNNTSEFLIDNNYYNNF